jgi:uncharacterized repeat protein (TIGR03803 family)
MTSRTMLVTLSLLMFCAAAAPLHAQIFQDQYDFNCSLGGCFPYDFGQLTQGNDGNLYGTTVDGIASGGSLGLGTVFEVSTSGSYAPVWQFDGAPTGELPMGGLTLASDGNFYGTASAGGTFGNGTLFRITSGGSLTVLHHFSNTEGAPLVAPVEANNGTIDALYGVTGSGTTYRVTLPAGTYKLLPNKAPGPTFGPFLLASDGNLYGTTQTGGTNNLGTVFRMTTAGGIKIIHSFSGADGAAPEGPLTSDFTNPWDGILYGTTDSGGLNNTGTVFQLTLSSGALKGLHNFDAYVGGFTCNNDGGNPTAGLLVASDGYFYGVTSGGGANCIGTIFRFALGGFFNKLFDFDESGVTSIYGETAYTTLMEHTNGCLFGLTSSGGASNGQTNPMGNFYSLCPEKLIQIVKVEGPIFVHPGVPVQILGNNLTQAVQVTFAGEQAQFQVGSDTYLVATVPSDAIDGLVAVTLAMGLQVETQSAMQILPLITNLDPTSGPVGTQVGIVGGGFNRTTKVTFGGVKATNFTVVSPTLIQAIVPTGARTGKVGVTTRNGTAKSKQTFTVN